jgi:hypothetical protein
MSLTTTEAPSVSKVFGDDAATGLARASDQHHLPVMLSTLIRGSLVADQ